MPSPIPDPLPSLTRRPASPEAAMVPYDYNSVPGYPIVPPASSVRAQVGRYLTFLGKKWWIVILSVLFFAGLATTYITWWPASYACTAHMWVAGRMSLRLQEGTTYDENDLNFAGTQVELLQSDMILGRALNRVQNTLHIAVPTNSEGKPKIPSIRVLQLPKSAVLELKAQGPTAVFVQAFLNATMDEFLAYKKELRSATSGDTYASVSEEITRQEAELQAQQDKLSDYMRENNVAVLEEQAKAASAYLTQLLAQLSQTKLEYQILEAMSGEGPLALAARTNVVAAGPDVRRLAPGDLPSASPSPEILTAQQDLEKLRILRTNLSEYLRPEHAKIVKLDQEISMGANLVIYLTNQSYAQLESVKQTAKVKIDRVQETVKEWEVKVNNASERIAEYERIKLSVERLQSLHDRLLGLLQSVDVSRNLDQENITILDRASEPKDAKKSSLMAAFLLFVGIGVGLGLLFLVERSDDRVMSLEEMGGRFDEWIMGQVPEVPGAKRKRKPALVEMNDDRHTFAESYRNIRSALTFAKDGEEKAKLLLVTSAIPNEGKSTVAANLARTLAFAGSRVLLVDGDLRRGTLHQLFDLPQEPGLADLLSDSGNLSKFVKEISLAPVNAQSHPPTTPPLTSAPRPPTLHFLPRGRSVDNPGELLIGAECSRLLAQLRRDYDCVILDSIPVFAADDTTTIAPKLDGVIFVVRNSFTSADTARHALELLYERHAKIMGLVLNRSDARSRSYRYYKYADYYVQTKP